jgi:hypothetical protein
MLVPGVTVRLGVRGRRSGCICMVCDMYKYSRDVVIALELRLEGLEWAIEPTCTTY